MNKVLPYKFKNTILAMFIFIFMIYGYISFIFPVFAYSGFRYEPSLIRILESLILFVVTLIFINFKYMSKFMYAVNMIVFLFMSMPNYVLYMFMDISRMIPYSYFIMHIVLILLSLSKINFKSYLLKPEFETKTMIAIVIIMLIPFVLTYGTHLNFKVLLFQDIYKVRRYVTAHTNVLTTYFYSWLTNAAIPFLVVYGYVNKNKKIIVFGIFSMLYLYILAAHKSIFFSLLLLLFLNLFKGYEKKIFVLYLIIAMVLLFGIIMFDFKDNIMISSMFLRRVFFLPSLLNHYYFEFFNNNFLYLSHSIFKHFMDYPYTMVPSHVIGDVYFHNPDMGANNGLISDGYMNFGYIGIFINIFIFGFIMKFLESININELLFPLLYYFIFALNSSAMLTVLLTHGLILFLIMVLFFNKRLNILQKIEN